MKLKKILCLILCLGLLASVASLGAAASGGTPRYEGLIEYWQLDEIAGAKT